MFTDPKKPHAQPPSLQCKAAESKHLAPALLPVLKTLLLGPRSLHGASSAVPGRTCESSSLFLTSAEKILVEDLAKGFLDSYAWLSAWALEKRKCTFHKVIKFHIFQHLILNARFLNPRGHWTFKDEDFVGRQHPGSFSEHGGEVYKTLSKGVAQVQHSSSTALDQARCFAGHEAV